MTSIRVTVILLALAALAIFGWNCSPTSDYPPDVAAALKKAGGNRKELKKVLTHYVSQGDTLKLKAAFYLIGNMEDHCYVTYALQDSSGQELPFNILDYPDFDSLLAAVDSLEKQYGEIDFERKVRVNDLDSITADYLIEQIDYAFRAWRERPWARQTSFECFCDYVLPYRGSNEPLESWRSIFWDKYNGIVDSMVDSLDPMEAARLINNDVRSWFKFDRRYYFHPTDQGASEMMKTHMGRCEDMTNLTIYALRANGLAVTSDYTPHWANAGNNHAWNAIITPEDKAVPFMGAEANPGEYQLRYKMAKAYRKMFGKQKENLAFQDNKQEKTPAWLSGKSYRDVTADYVDARDVTVEFDKPVPDSVNIAYLCVFNSGKWRAIHWGRIKDNRAVFSDMGPDIAYLPALYLNEEIVPWGAPFILDGDGQTHPLRADTTNTTSGRLTSITQPEQASSTDGVKEVLLTDSVEYELSYWNDSWCPIGKAVVKNGHLKFENIPVGGLYWLVAVDGDQEERIFTLDNNRQVWW